MKKLCINTIAIAFYIAISCFPSKEMAEPVYDNEAKDLANNKSRALAPRDDQIERSVSIDGLLNSGDKEGTFSDSDAVRIEGYLFDFAEQNADGKASCSTNEPCNTVMYISKDDKATQNIDCLCVVITPATKALNPFISQEYLKSIKGKRVLITGWLLFDNEHTGNSLESHPMGFKLTRHTAWEIYPVTSIKVDE